MKVLFITRSNIQQKLNSGGFIVARRNYELVRKHFGDENVYCFIIDSEVGDDSDKFKYFYREKTNLALYFNYAFLRDGYGRNIEKKLINSINDLSPNIIFVDGSTFGQIFNKINFNPKIILYMHNIEKTYSWERVLKNSKLCIFRYFAYWYNERAVVKKATKVLCINERDARELEKYYERKADALMPVSFQDSFLEYDMKKYLAEKERFIIFVGSYFLPNYQGILWFVENVMPQLPFKLKIIGKGMEQKRRELERDNVEVLGTVDNLAEYYYASEAVIMPIFLGSGMKVKTAEALMYGKTIFATKEALEGYCVQNLAGIYECNTAEEFVNNILHHMGAENRKYNIKIRKYFLENYETKVIECEMNKILNEVRKECT